MEYRIIKTPSKGTRDMMKKRMGFYREAPEIIEKADAIGLVQGLMIDMVCAADVAEKAVGVEVFDVHGVCPQHMTLLAIFGDTAAVYDAIRQIQDKLKKNGGTGDYVLV